MTRNQCRVVPFRKFWNQLKGGTHCLGQGFARHTGRHRIDRLDGLNFRALGFCANPIGVGDLIFVTIMIDLARHDALFPDGKHIIEVFGPRIKK